MRRGDGSIRYLSAVILKDNPTHGPAGASRRARRKRAASKKNERWKGGWDGAERDGLYGAQSERRDWFIAKRGRGKWTIFQWIGRERERERKRQREGARWKNGIFPWENGILSAPRPSERSASRHTCFSHPPVILRVFRYSRERDSGGYGVGYVRLRDNGGREDERRGTHRKLWLSSRSRHRCRTDGSMNVCMRYELYALCIERADDKKSRAYGRRDSHISHWRVHQGGERGREERRVLSVHGPDRYYFVNQSKEYPNISSNSISRLFSLILKLRSSVLPPDYRPNSLSSIHCHMIVDHLLRFKMINTLRLSRN